ncbi:DGQHR domain-containing protein [Fibrobacter sp. UWH4]|uniref:DGQHR domain-containing protein n=1 Tax=Fibrobacter sp. UWH4 TaxID=1896210 RepID=UPI00091998F6|nr:DGQHR domain-containing protein [Fibrobacter sp. UWH4]SHL55512.1 DGQHR domain-containing protein [Fibrobacter sp. UWH4]
MRKIYLQKITQHDIECYIGCIDPRDLVRVATKIEIAKVQDAQRPLNGKRIKEIASYVSEKKGILPNTLTLATKDKFYQIRQHSSFKELYYIEFPDSEDEFKQYAESIDVMDGQHRLYSFAEKQRLIQDDEKFEIGFTLFIRPSLSDRRQIFISCNEKQEKVSSNLLMWLKEKLGMLRDDEIFLYSIVSKLSNEYPLKGHIIMNAEKVKNGVKAKELMGFLKQIKIRDLAIDSEPLTEDEIIHVICTYLIAWEDVVDFTFAPDANGKFKPNAGVAVKTAGLKYMLLLLPTFWDRAVSMQKLFNAEFIQDTIKRFISSYAEERSLFFALDEHKKHFADRTAIQRFADEGIKKIKALNAGKFNPLGK